MAIVGRGEQPARALPAGAASAANFPATCLRHWFPDKSPRGRLAGSLTPAKQPLHVPPPPPGAAAPFTIEVAASLPQAGAILAQLPVSILHPPPQVGPHTDGQAGVQAARLGN